MMSMLGIRQIAVLVNKMDLVNYDKNIYDKIVSEYTRFLKEIKVIPYCFIPVSGIQGDTIAKIDSNMSWYRERTVLDVLDQFGKEKPPIDKPFRMPVQDVYKFTNYGDSRRIVVGTIESGSIKEGDEIIFYPSGKKSTLKTIELFNAPPQKTSHAGQAAGFTLSEQIYVTRGEMAALAKDAKPQVTTRLKVNLFWLGKKPLVTKKDYHIKIGTAKVPFRVEEILMVMDASDLSARTDKQSVDRNDVAECIIKCGRPISFDLAEDNATTSRFVIIDNYEIWGGGIIRESIEDRHARLRDMVFLRDYKWEKSTISFENRAEKFSQKSTLILVTGKKEKEKKRIAKELEARLFADGKIVYFLGIGNVLYGIDADIKKTANNREEHIRRLAEVAHIMLDAGVILIVTAIELTQDDLEILKTSINPDRIEVVWVGDDVTTDISYDLILHDEEDTEMSVDRIKNMLHDKGIIFKPW
jgi:bifunctional enzyme CysN/CysC